MEKENFKDGLARGILIGVAFSWGLWFGSLEPIVILGSMFVFGVFGLLAWSAFRAGYRKL